MQYGQPPKKPTGDDGKPMMKKGPGAKQRRMRRRRRRGPKMPASGLSKVKA